MDIKEINYQKKYIEATKTIDRLTSDNVNLHAEVDNFKDFVEQEERQFELIKQNESQQAKFQTQKLQWNNYQVLNFQIIPTDSTASQAYFNSDYNDSVAVGTALDGGIMFGTNTADVSKAKYYNIVSYEFLLNFLIFFNNR